jgi:hypothetical protein
MVGMLAKISVTETKGSLLSAIEKLLRVIDVSENSIMIPTLLKDKCEFDANEMLTLAKILKASILGHNDLVEFYMSESSSQQYNNSICSSSSIGSNISNNNHHHANGRQYGTPSLRSSTSESTTSSQLSSTPSPSQADSLGRNGDPDATVRLLHQIEQLKIFIPQVTGIFESIIELYKNSVDTITYRTNSHNC